MSALPPKADIRRCRSLGAWPSVLLLGRKWLQEQLTGAAHIKYQERVCWYVEEGGGQARNMVVSH